MNPAEPLAKDSSPPAGWRYVRIAEDQPQYQTLPALVSHESIVTVWEPTAEELAQLSTGGAVKLEVLNYGKPMQPVRLEVIGGERDLRVGAGEDPVPA